MAVALLLAGTLVMVIGSRMVEAYRAAGVAQASQVAPTSGPPQVAGPSRPRTLTVLGAGDVLVHPEVWQQADADAKAAGQKGFDFFPMFAGVSKTISGADLAICHLETPLANADGPFLGYPTFSVPPQVTQGIKKAGFDACSTASNHTIDYGLAGVTRTIEALDAAGLGHAGSYTSAAAAATPTIYDVKGVKVAHLAYAMNFNGLRRPAGKDWMANLIEPEKIIAAAHQAREAGAEIVVLSMHWGTEYNHAPDANQLAWAKQVIASPDIDMVLGHHAHVVQPFERFGDKWVVYGMGNELARHSQPVNDNREGVMARITFTQVGPKRWRITRAEAIPTWVEISPKIRLVELPSALSSPETTAAQRKTYQAAYDRVKGFLTSRGAGSAGLMVVAPS